MSQSFQVQKNTFIYQSGSIYVKLSNLNTRLKIHPEPRKLILILIMNIPHKDLLVWMIHSTETSMNRAESPGAIIETF
jgi:hypothetical protein